MKYRAAYHTDVGIKKKNNQDSLAIKIAETPNGQAAFAIICDGMGGLAKGELASKEVINAYCGWFEHDFVKLVRTGTFNTAILKEQWDRIAVTENEKLKAYGESRGIMIGTTLSAILMYEDRYYIIHVGDSRVYELTDKMEQLTQDQTLVAREIAAGRLTPEQAENHPARWCLAEVCNVHSPAIEIEPIHRVLFGVDANTVAADFGSWLEQHGAALQGGDQHIVLAGAGAEITFDAANTPDPLAVGTTEHFIGDYLAQNPGVTVDYIHGAAAARAMAADPAKPATALLMPDFAKADLFKGVVLGGVLPRKTFSMGHAEEKRYYNECRSLTMPD